MVTGLPTRGNDSESIVTSRVGGAGREKVEDDQMFSTGCRTQERRTRSDDRRNGAKGSLHLQQLYVQQYEQPETTDKRDRVERVGLTEKL